VERVAPPAEKGQKKKVSLIAAIVLLVISGAFLGYAALRTRPGSNAAAVNGGMPTSPSGSESARASGTPGLASAVITPENPTTDSQLSLDYSGQGQDGVAANCRFRWYVNGRVIQEGPSPTLAPENFKKGSIVCAEIIPGDASGEGTAYRTPEVAIGNRPPVVSSVTLVPVHAPVDTVVRAEVAGQDPDGDTVSYTYQWGLNGKYVTGPGKENTFSTAGLHKKDKLYVTVTPSDGYSTGAPKASDISFLSNSAPRITSSPNYEIVNGLYTYQVTAVDPDNDSITFSLLKGPQGMTIDSASGLIRWETPKDAAGRQEIPIKISADDGDGGTTYQDFSIILEMKQ